MHLFSLATLDFYLSELFQDLDFTLELQICTILNEEGALQALHSAHGSCEPLHPGQSGGMNREQIQWLEQTYSSNSGFLGLHQIPEQCLSDTFQSIQIQTYCCVHFHTNICSDFDLLASSS
ncbi:hypothetical protein ILYODFUR_016256 [Ilyodon furcidens]|uniref:Uncharacterized protein n=1 Tax=Ilyodon furcidens TaxID=33524 RepID=A0ABV0TM08_9TELE